VITPLPEVSLADFPGAFGEHAVVVRGLAHTMPAFRWTDDLLNSHVGDTKVLVRFAGRRDTAMRMRDFLTYLRQYEQISSAHGPAYLTDYHVFPAPDDARAPLASDVGCPLPLPFTPAQWVSLYAGPPGTATVVHQDVFDTHTWMAVLRGTKTWRLCAPSDLDDDRASSFDAFDPAHDDGPQRIFHAEVSAGDVIYLPPRWWHHVKNQHDATLALSGNVCTVAQAKAHRAALRGSNGRERDTYLTLWERILAHCDACTGDSD
jgi:hypothetical protein